MNQIRQRRQEALTDSLQEALSSASEFNQALRDCQRRCVAPVLASSTKVGAGRDDLAIVDIAPDTIANWRSCLRYLRHEVEKEQQPQKTRIRLLDIMMRLDKACSGSYEVIRNTAQENLSEEQPATA